MQYQRLGNYIKEVNVRNWDEKVTNLQGVSISKMFIPSIANTIGTDMSAYKIVKPRQFAYGPVTKYLLLYTRKVKMPLSLRHIQHLMSSVQIRYLTNIS